MIWQSTILMAVAGALSLAAGSAAPRAQALDPQFHKHAFEAADRNRDGAIDEAELTADVAAAFAALDRDGDLRLDMSELAGADAKLFAAIDADGDGKLSFREVMVHKLRQVEAADRDDDGLVTHVEAASFHGRR